MRKYLFTITSRGYKFRAEWASISRFSKFRYFFFFFNHETGQVVKLRRFDLCLFGLVLTLTMPYHKKFTYKNMPKVQGRRKVK